MFFTILLYPEYLENTQYTDHDESIFISVMRAHEICNLPSKIDNEYQEQEYTHH